MGAQVAQGVVYADANNNGVLEVSHLENEVLLYPNPTQSTITIEHPSIEKIAIYDMMGRKVKTLANSFQLSLIHI